MDEPNPIAAVEFVLPCETLDGTLEFLLDELGFRLELIFPADAPRVAVVSGFGTRFRLEAGEDRGPARLRLVIEDADALCAETLKGPAGLPIEVAAAESSVELPPLVDTLIVQRAEDAVGWGEGRAGMQYRDLIPGRLGGRFIASRIRIPTGGPVPDYVHHHRVRFQMIYCYRGWVRVVYEDQGPPFVMRAGDAVLQPPHIRHRVLECSDGFEVVEIGCPAEHETIVDHDMALPTAVVKPGREFAGQRFVFHQAEKASWTPWANGDYEARDTGIGAATGGLASAAVLRPAGNARERRLVHDAELLFRFVLEGSVVLRCDGTADAQLSAGDAFSVPAGMPHTLSQPSGNLEMLEVSLPANYRTITES